MFSYKETYRAICAECNLEFEIFAKPDENKPVYCQECYMQRKQSSEQ